MLVIKALLVALISASTVSAGLIPSGNYVFHHNPIFQHSVPSYQIPFNYYPSPSFTQVQQIRPQFVAATPSRPQFVAIHSETENKPQANNPVTNIPQQSAVAVPVFQNVVAIHAERPRKLVLSYPPQEQYPSQVPNYSYDYSVKDKKTGDEKSHQESRNGDDVVGKYTVVEPDGTLRVVSYTAGKEGFKAVVKRTPGYTTPNAPNSGSTNAIAKPIFAASPVTYPSAIAVPVSSNYPSGFHFGG